MQRRTGQLRAGQRTCPPRQSPQPPRPGARRFRLHPAGCRGRPLPRSSSSPPPPCGRLAGTAREVDA